MKRWAIAGAGLGMLLLIFDSRCAAQSAQEALALCLKTVIPSLFPMFVLSGLLVSGLGGASGRLFSPLERITGLPEGSGVLFLMGIVGGFPVGAQCIAQAVEKGSLSREDGERMLGFCNNCSPAFLFGILGSVLSDPLAPLLIFLIQLETALVTASFTPLHQQTLSVTAGGSCSLSAAVTRGIRSMASVCAWVVLAGVVTGFLDRWIFPLMPLPMPQLLGGMLEITGGILGLAAIPEEHTKFLLCALFVCFGGLSVWMQISSLASAQGLSAAICFRQKTVQAILGGLIAATVLGLGPVGLLLPVILLIVRKKRLENPTDSVYNSPRKGGLDHVVP